MIDLGRIQQRLNTDNRYREEFLKDPVGTLRREGLVLPPSMHLRVRQQAAHLTRKRPQRGAPALPAVQLEFTLG